MQLFRNIFPSFWDGAIDVVSSGKAADVRNSILGQELPPDEERLYEEDVLAAKARELDAWLQFKVFGPMEPRTCNEDVAGSRWVMTW